MFGRWAKLDIAVLPALAVVPRPGRADLDPEDNDQAASTGRAR